MRRTEVKKFRLTPEEARRLRRWARQDRTSESRVFRHMMELEARVRARRENIEGLIAMTRGEEEPPKIRFELK